MMTQQRTAWAVALVIIAVSWAGCASPEASVQRADLRDVSLQALEIGVTLDLHNPNDFSIPVEGIDWNLSLFDDAVASGQANPQSKIPAGATRDVDVPISLRLSDLRDTASHLRSSSHIPYEVAGTVNFEVPTGTVSVDFSRDGRWNNPLR